MRFLAVAIGLALQAPHGFAQEKAAQVGSVWEGLRPAPGGTGESFRCRGEVEPDRVAVVGGISARSLRPSEARAELEAQLDAIRALVERHGGELALQERVRGVRPPSGGRIEPGEAPFVVVQRLELVFGADAPIDAILDEALRSGLDQFGRDVSLHERDTRLRLPVRYRFSDLPGRLEALYERCRHEAWQAWCERRAPEAEREACRAAYPAVGAERLAGHFVFESQPLLNEHGTSAPLQIPHPWPARIGDQELLGRVPLRLEGLLRLTTGPEFH